VLRRLRVRLARLLRHCLLVAFADSLSLGVVAEGIEQPEQVGSLRDLNCRLGQGFHFSRPMAPPAAEMFCGASSIRGGAKGPRFASAHATLDREHAGVA
jgi:predicted signal transduction protein with EAL and GGDEF domain